MHESLDVIELQSRFMIVSPLVERIKNCDNIFKFVLIKCLRFSRDFFFAFRINEICRGQLLDHGFFYFWPILLAILSGHALAAFIFILR